MPRGRRGETAGRAIKLRPSNPFDLIRWLARSQSDPRKAVAELVQNSLDAGARHVRVERRRIMRSPSLVVWDDGEGVLPEMSRDEALSEIAEHIGHSRKMQLTPAERRERVVAGMYGVGLLGFWAVGHRFELRSRVGGSRPWALRLVEDQERGHIVELPLRTDAPATFTEAVVFDVHDAALRALGGARLAVYLGSELRGQLACRDVELVVLDYMARGLAQKRFEVKPKRFIGERLALPAEVPVERHGTIRVELYLARGEARSTVQIACAGTVVADRVEDLAALGLEGTPWVGRDLSGMLDYADFSVPPGTRRGVVPDDAARSFVAAVDERLRPLVEAELERFELERREMARRDVASELRRALRGLSRRLPQYALPEVSDGRDASTGGNGAAAEAGAGLATADEAMAHGANDGLAPQADLFPPGPLASLQVTPDPAPVPVGGERRLRATARDADKRLLNDGVSYAWRIEGAHFTLRGEGARAAVAAAPDAPVGAVARVTVTAEEGERLLSASSDAVVVEDERAGTRIGVPDPHYVSDPAGAWRSRFDGRVWEVNDAHEDFVALRADTRGRFRYLLTLFRQGDGRACIGPARHRRRAREHGRGARPRGTQPARCLSARHRHARPTALHDNGPGCQPGRSTSPTRCLGCSAPCASRRASGRGHFE